MTIYETWFGAWLTIFILFYLLEELIANDGI